MASIEVPAFAKLGSKRENSGRRKIFANEKKRRKIWGMEHERIYLNVKIYETWAKAKTTAGYGRSSDSEFAAHLLSLEFRRR